MVQKRKVQDSLQYPEADQSHNNTIKNAHTLYTDVSTCKSRHCYSD
ncbi:MAG: hypothetical protein J6U21_14385 [Bacteroidales bacterium]|nr:hypothetical protein [Bacteroidales bacterium]